MKSIGPSPSSVGPNWAGCMVLGAGEMREMWEDGVEQGEAGRAGGEGSYK